MRKLSWLWRLMLVGAVALWALPFRALGPPGTLADCGCEGDGNDGGDKGSLTTVEHELDDGRLLTA